MTPMTAPQPHAHCNHECVCDDFHPEYDPDYQEVCNNKDCEHDTRATNTNPPAPDTDRHDPRIELRRVCEQEEHDAQVAKAEREQVLETLEDLRKWSNGEYNEAYLSDNEREMRIHNDYGCKIWGVMESLRTQPENTTSSKE
jgi:hypothetical protein